MLGAAINTAILTEVGSAVVVLALPDNGPEEVAEGGELTYVIELVDASSESLSVIVGDPVCKWLVVVSVSGSGASTAFAAVSGGGADVVHAQLGVPASIGPLVGYDDVANHRKTRVKGSRF